MKNTNRILLFILMLGVIQSGFGQLYINEFMASNASVIEDPDFTDYSDWIEIYNAGSADVDLKGYYITDNISKPDKWQLNVSLVVPSRGYALIWADGEDKNNHTSFKLSLEGEEVGLFDPSLNPVDTLSFSHQKSDVSFGRDQSNINNWLFFGNPTPGKANNTIGYLDFVKQVPDFTVMGRIFEQPISLKIFADVPGEIRYTTDGSEPQASSILFTDNLIIDSTTIIRARLFQPGKLPGPIVTHSYFKDDNYKLRKLPIVSVVSEPDNFWDKDLGIYVQDFKPEWEIPINIELFENNGSDRAAFNEAAGAKINGLYSWQLPQKMLGVYFRNRYGSSSLEYPLFFDRTRSNFESFALRASGNDWSNTLFRDILGQHMTTGNMDLDKQGQRASIVYYNGQYMGIHNMRSKVDADYIISNYGWEPGSFDMIENEDYVEEGSLDEYAHFKSLYSKDLTVQANFDAVAELMDIENFTDYIITEIYVRNTSIGHNVMAYKHKGEGKWKWILMDLDRGFLNPGSNLISYMAGQSNMPFGDLLDNAGYRAYFAQRLANHMATTLHPDRIKQKIDEFAAVIEAEVPNHIERWKGTTSSYGDAIPSFEYWQDEVAALKSYAEQRPAILIQDLENYGISGLINYTITSSHPDAAVMLMNDMKLGDMTTMGTYPSDIAMKLEVLPRPGYNFVGWQMLDTSLVIPAGDTWKYKDDGSDQGSVWYTTDFTDAGWSSGTAQFGYGDGDEATVINSGGSTKYITSYFRKTFNVTGASDAIVYTLNLLCDDGAVVYINGQEVARSNMPSGSVDYQTQASSAVGGAAEDAYTSYNIETNYIREGANVIAVEVHQSATNSSDVSFDLSLSVLTKGSGAPIATATFAPDNSSDFGVMAVFEKSDECILFGNIDQSMTLSKDCSPYYIDTDIRILEGVILTIDPGVELYLNDGASIFVNGQMMAMGTEAEPIVLKSDPDSYEHKWGSLIFENTAETSKLSHVTVIDASTGVNRNMFPAAIAAFNAKLEMDHIFIDNVHSNPIAARYSSVRFTDSYLHSKVTGDLINVKYGQAYIRNCTFLGNDQSDTDAVDLDDVEDGIISNCLITDLVGSNSDAIDIGENAQNIMIDSVIVYHVTDKGVSVGQRSSARVSNSMILNCNLGLGLKDSCKVVVDRCTLYGNNFGISCYEKNLGKAGGNVVVRNSIISNSGESSAWFDQHSTLKSEYTLTDNTTVPGETNKFSDPLFTNPNMYDFSLKATSPARSYGLEDGEPIDLGANLQLPNFKTHLIIAGIYNNDLQLDLPEYIVLINPSNEQWDISGYSFIKGITHTFSEGTVIAPSDTIYLTDDENHSFWKDELNMVIQWQDGKLSNDGESLEIVDPYGSIIDRLVYEENEWPSVAGTKNIRWELKSLSYDNHFGYNWLAIAVETPIDTVSHEVTGLRDFNELYPNPASTYIHVSGLSSANGTVKILNMEGKVLKTVNTGNVNEARIDLSGIKPGVYLISVNGKYHKFFITR